MTLTFSEAVATFTNSSGKGLPDSLSVLCSDLFTIVITISSNIDMGKPEDCRKIINYHLHQFEEQAVSIRIRPEIIEKAKYAIVILLDEKIGLLPRQWFDKWLINKTLQDEHFGETVGGVRFFDYLDELMQNPDLNGEVLEIYYLCLGMGFTGKYHQEPNRLKKITGNLGAIVLQNHKRKSKPVTAPPEIFKKKVVSRKTVPQIPVWLLVIIALAIMGASRMIVSVTLNRDSEKIVPNSVNENRIETGNVE